MVICDFLIFSTKLEPFHFATNLRPDKSVISRYSFKDYFPAPELWSYEFTFQKKTESQDYIPNLLQVQASTLSDQLQLMIWAKKYLRLLINQDKLMWLVMKVLMTMNPCSTCCLVWFKKRSTFAHDAKKERPRTTLCFYAISFTQNRKKSRNVLLKKLCVLQCVLNKPHLPGVSNVGSIKPPAKSEISKLSPMYYH